MFTSAKETTSTLSLTSQQKEELKKSGAEQAALKLSIESLTKQEDALKSELKSVQNKLFTLRESSAKLLRQDESIAIIDDSELNKLFSAKIPGTSLRCQINRQTEMLEINIYRTSDVSEIKKLLIACGNANPSVTIHKDMHGNTHVFAEVNLKDRETLLKGLKLASEVHPAIHMMMARC